jgi:HEAT repeat protein
MTYEEGYAWLQNYLDDHLDEIVDLMENEADPEMRSRLVEIVGDSKNPRIIPKLQEELKNPNRKVRMWAYNSLAYLGDSTASAIAAEFEKDNPDEDFL